MRGRMTTTTKKVANTTINKTVQLFRILLPESSYSVPAVSWRSIDSYSLFAFSGAVLLHTHEWSRATFFQFLLAQVLTACNPLCFVKTRELLLRLPSNQKSMLLSFHKY